VIELANKIRSGDRRAISEALTLIESSKSDHRQSALELLEMLQDDHLAVRLGVSGVPGVGKSTFIESLGLQLISEGKSVAVLSVDPSSAITGGSILGDKTRMEMLSRSTSAYIRPSPAGGNLGGVARRTRESIAILEAAEFDVIIVETVGVGQSETVVAGMTDLFLLLLLPGGGDELQGIKRGIMELADIIVVNKADGERIADANRAVSEYRLALSLMQRRIQEWETPVLTCSARDGTGIQEVSSVIETYIDLVSTSGYLQSLRASQRVLWFSQELDNALAQLLLENPELVKEREDLEKRVHDKNISPVSASAQLIASFLNQRK